LTYRLDLPQIYGVMFLIVTLHLFIRVVLVLGEQRGRSLLLFLAKPPRGGHVLNQVLGLVVKVVPAVPPELLGRQGVIVTITMLKRPIVCVGDRLWVESERGIVNWKRSLSGAMTALQSTSLKNLNSTNY